MRDYLIYSWDAGPQICVCHATLQRGDESCCVTVPALNSFAGVRITPAADGFREPSPIIVLRPALLGLRGASQGCHAAACLNIVDAGVLLLATSGVADTVETSYQFNFQS